jgi:hypothetical protein
MDSGISTRYRRDDAGCGGSTHHGLHGSRTGSGWPFASTSIWKMPIGKSAHYVSTESARCAGRRQEAAGPQQVYGSPYTTTERSRS